MVNHKKYNLLGHPEKLIRDVSIRFKDKELKVLGEVCCVGGH